MRERWTPEPNTGCWLWLGAVGKKGYGILRVGKRFMSAHRWALQQAAGPDERYVLHSCDQPTCVNPAHLRYGTSAENAADREARKRSMKYTMPQRQVRGERHGAAKLTEADVLEIRHLYFSTPIKQKELANRYNTVQSTISNIVTGRKWRSTIRSSK